MTPLEAMAKWVDDDTVCVNDTVRSRLRWLAAVADAANRYMETLQDVERCGSDEQLDAVDLAEDTLRASLTEWPL